MNKNLHKIIIASIFLTLLSCGNDNKNDNKNAETIQETETISEAKDSINETTEITENVRIIADTLVIFFLPSPKERQKMILFYGTYNKYEFQTLFSDQINLYKIVKNALKKHNIKVETSFAERFLFPIQDTITYDLKIESQIIGFILFDGVNPPMIKNGIPKKNSISNDIKSYFNLKNFYLYD